MSTLKKLALLGVTVYLVLWFSLDGPDDPDKSESADNPGSNLAADVGGSESASPEFVPAIPDSAVWTREEQLRQRQAEPERSRTRSPESKTLSRMEIDNAVARATMGMHTGNPDVGFGTCRYTHNYSLSSQSSERIRASAEFICTSRDSRTGRTVKQTVWKPVILKRYGGSWVADHSR